MAEAEAVVRVPVLVPVQAVAEQAAAKRIHISRKNNKLKRRGKAFLRLLCGYLFQPSYQSSFIAEIPLFGWKTESR